MASHIPCIMTTASETYRRFRSAASRAALWILALVAGMAVASCGNDGTFRLNGKINNFGTGNLRVVYYADGAVQSVVAPAIDGKFSMSGRLQRPVMARIYTGNGVIVGRFAARPGETVNAEFDAADPTVMKFDGNDDSRRLAEFIGANAASVRDGNTAALNSAIADYVANNSKRLVSGILLADYFDLRGHEAQAHELIESLSDEVAAAASLHGLSDLTRTLAIPADSLLLEPFTLFTDKGSRTEINPQSRPLTMLMFTDNASRPADSIETLTGELSAMEKNRLLQMVDISCDPDTAAWLESVRNLHSGDSAKVTRGWTPAPFNIMGLEDIAVATVPWFVVADSTRRIIYKGPSAAAARRSVEKH